MLSLVTAAEVQYRHDVWSRDRDHAVLAAIRDRRDDSLFEAAAFPAAPVERIASAARETRRVGWARPIGARVAPDCPQSACAIA
jgi:hypothetical protein